MIQCCRLCAEGGPPQLARLTPNVIGTAQYAAPELMNEDLLESMRPDQRYLQVCCQGLLPYRNAQQLECVIVALHHIDPAACRHCLLAVAKATHLPAGGRLLVWGDAVGAAGAQAALQGHGPLPDPGLLPVRLQISQRPHPICNVIVYGFWWRCQLPAPSTAPSLDKGFISDRCKAVFGMIS
jgi:hypothetical protein